MNSIDTDMWINPIVGEHYRNEITNEIYTIIGKVVADNTENVFVTFEKNLGFDNRVYMRPIEDFIDGDLVPVKRRELWLTQDEYIQYKEEKKNK